MRAPILTALAALTALIGAASADTCALTKVELPPGMDLCPYTGVAPLVEGETPLLAWTFEDSVDGFTPASGATGAIVRDGTARTGEACYRLDCAGVRARDGEMPPGLLWQSPPTPVGSLAFSVHAARPARVGLLASEADGSFYMALLFVPADRWQRIVLDTRDMSLVRDDSSDENGRLDPDQIAFLGMVDAGMFAGEGADWISDMELRLDDVEILREPVRRKPLEDAAGQISLGSFAVSCLGWMPAGSSEYSAELGDESEEPFLSLRPSHGAGFAGWFLMPRMFGVHEPWLTLQFDVRCESATTLAVVLSEDTGGEWVQIAEALAPGEWTTICLRAAGFEPSQEKPDTANGRLDTDRLATIAFLRIPNAETAARPTSTIDLRRPIVVPVPAGPQTEDPFQ